MAKNPGLKKAAVKIGAAVGRAEGTARNLGKAARVAREELTQLTKRFEELTRDLKRASKRLKGALR